MGTGAALVLRQLGPRGPWCVVLGGVEVWRDYDRVTGREVAKVVGRVTGQRSVWEVADGYSVTWPVPVYAPMVGRALVTS